MYTLKRRMLLLIDFPQSAVRRIDFTGSKIIHKAKHAKLYILDNNFIHEQEGWTGSPLPLRDGS